MNTVEVQRACDSAWAPDSGRIRNWAAAVLNDRIEGTESVIRLVDVDESARLNLEYRSKQGPTNVLSFGYGPLTDSRMKLLGDIVICAPVVASEAAEQEKDPEAHWAHMVVHGLLHLLGYDHIDECDASRMESLELEILAGLGYPDPYQEVADL
jgi:probable rRNA maturation factor